MSRRPRCHPILIALACVLVACQAAPTGPPPPQDSPPDMKVHVAWQVDNADPEQNYLSVFASTVYIPLIARRGLEAVDAETGHVEWSVEDRFYPETNAVVHGTDVFIVGTSYSDASGLNLYWLKVDGTYQGRFSIGGAAPFGLTLVGDALFWSSDELYRFDLTGTFQSLGGEIFDPSGHFSEFFTRPVLPDKVISVSMHVSALGRDVVWAYENDQPRGPHEPPVQVVRSSSSTGQTLWEYPTIHAQHFVAESFVSYGDQILLVGGYGMELINANNPSTDTTQWAFGDEAHSWTSTGIVAADVYYSVSPRTDRAVSAFSLVDGRRLWTLPNASSIEDNPQFEKGVLYVAAAEGITAIDAKKGRWIGRDSAHPGYFNQVGRTVRYNNLMIYYTDRLPGTKGRVEAIYMDVAPLP